jgi:hypothetical protein
MKARWHLAILGTIGCALPHAASAAENSWSMARERYVCYASGMTLQELGSAGVTVISHAPANRQYFQEAQQWGIKVCPYISLYKVAVPGKDNAWLSPNEAYPNNLPQEPFWKEVDASHHPEWFLRRDDGQIRRPFDIATYPVNFEQSCCNQRSLLEAYERGVRNVMELGAGGVFVDNVHPHPTCAGATLGLHAHDWPDKDNAECYKLALQRVHDAVKSYGQDRVVILNSDKVAEYASCGDGVMWESFIWRSPFAGEQAPLVTSRLWGPHSWEKLRAALPRWRPRAEQGPSIAPLTYLPDPSSEAENAFFAYAAARLADLDQWSATAARRRDILRRLYRIQTGPPLGEPVATGEVVYRPFQNAVVACNFSTETAEVRWPIPAALGTAPVDLYTMRTVPLVAGEGVLSLPPQSGRVIVARGEALDNLLREIEGQAVAARLRLQEKRPGSDASAPAPLMTQLQDLEARAGALRRTLPDAASSTTGAWRQALATLTKAATAMPMPAPADSFLAERLDNLTRHADCAAGLVAN